MKEFKITAEALPSGKCVFGVELADNLRDAWRFFKKSHNSYILLRFHSAYTSERYYFKVY